MSQGFFHTHLFWENDQGEEFSPRVRVDYSFTKGTKPSFDDPGSPDEIEVLSISAVSGDIIVPDHFLNSEEVLTECAEDHAAEQENAAEWRAQCRRDDALMGEIL